MPAYPICSSGFARRTLDHVSGLESSTYSRRLWDICRRVNIWHSGRHHLVLPLLFLLCLRSREHSASSCGCVRRSALVLLLHHTLCSYRAIADLCPYRCPPLTNLGLDLPRDLVASLSHRTQGVSLHLPGSASDAHFGCHRAH